MNKNITPRISIIIPTYNYLEGLKDCIDSVLSQLDAQFECIIVDDGSEKAFVDVLKQYEAEAPYLRIEYKEHEGAYAARNRGIALARGEYISFLDADDIMNEGFLKNALDMLELKADLYIFSIDTEKERNGVLRYDSWKLKDRVYESAADYADEYVRRRHLLLYSQCNKLYKRELLLNNRIEFPEESFGEDRLFNYKYLEICKRIISSSSSMFTYVMKDRSSQSKKSIAYFFDVNMRLHDEKMKCILNLSKGTSEEEKKSFVQYDLAKEIKNTAEHIAMHPEEIEQCLEKMNTIIFDEDNYDIKKAELVIVLGSRACEYRVKLAHELFGKKDKLMYLVSGGNMMAEADISEAEFMKNYLINKGVNADFILTENQARNTEENLINSEGLLRKWLEQEHREINNISIITAGFHVKRVKSLIEKNNLFEGKAIQYISAYGPNTARDKWYLNAKGREIIFNELKSRV